MVTTLPWTCTACGAKNQISDVRYEDFEDCLETRCPACGKRYYLSARPTAWELTSLEDADARDEEDEWGDALTLYYPCVKVSHDGGETWAEERINAVEFDPARNLTVRPGDLLIDQYDARHEVVLDGGRLKALRRED